MWPDAPPEARALFARTGQALRLTAVTPQAAKQGLRPGMTLADARARCPDLDTAPHDPGTDARALATLATGMVRFTPRVAIDGVDGLLLDITGCAHLFGGEDALARLAIEQAALTTRHAFAPHAAAARALARHGQPRGAIHALPIAALDPDGDTAAGLRRAGLRSIGDLAARPMAGLAARFGEGLVASLRAVLGEVASPQVTRARPAPIRAAARFPEPIARTADVLEVIENLIAQAAAQMAARDLGGCRFAIRLERSDHVKRDLVVDTSRPLRDPAAVMRLLRERIETLADPLDPGFGFDAVLLSVPRTAPLSAHQTAMEGAGQNDDTIAALVDRLSTRLGPDCVLRLHPCDTHIPENTQALRPAQHHGAAPWPASPIHPRPLSLLDPPQPIAAMAGVPDGPPLRFRWRGGIHEIARAEGPERIAAEWWHDPLGHLPGYRALTRDYYRVEDAMGQRFWVFRHGLFEEEGHPRWYLHGFFA